MACAPLTSCVTGCKSKRAARRSYYSWHWSAQPRFNPDNRPQMQRRADTFSARALLRCIDARLEITANRKTSAFTTALDYKENTAERVDQRGDRWGEGGAVGSTPCPFPLCLGGSNQATWEKTSVLGVLEPFGCDRISCSGRIRKVGKAMGGGGGWTLFTSIRSLIERGAFLFFFDKYSHECENSEELGGFGRPDALAWGDILSDLSDFLRCDSRLGHFRHVLGRCRYLHCSTTSVIFWKEKDKRIPDYGGSFLLVAFCSRDCNCSSRTFFNDRIFSYTLPDTSTLQEVSLERAHGVTIKYLPDVPSKARCIQKYWDTFNRAVRLI